MTNSTGAAPSGGTAYLDTAVAGPLHPAAREALLAAVDAGYADPLALHRPGRNARLVLDNARAVLAEGLGVRDDEVSLTGSATQAVHLGVLGLLRGRSRTSGRLVHSAVEHSAVLAAGTWWKREHGGAVHVVPVDRSGRVRLDALEEALAEPTGVLAVQAANAEVGTVQPVDEVVRLAGDVPVFCDVSAVAGQRPLPAGWAAAAASPPAWGGPAGTGVLLVRKGARWRPPFPTDERTDPRVAGLENVPGALAAAAALQATLAEREERAARTAALVDRVRDQVAATVPDVEVVGDPVDRVPHVVTFSCLYVDGEALVTELDRLGFAVASGSACTAAASSPSHVLEAMGVLTHGNVRISLGRDTTGEDVDRFLAALPGVVAELRTRAGVR